ncbi:hypothetical protein HK101_011067, partial [Irineochytrium annulatum]
MLSAGADARPAKVVSYDPDTGYMISRSPDDRQSRWSFDDLKKECTSVFRTAFSRHPSSLLSKFTPLAVAPSATAPILRASTSSSSTSSLSTPSANTPSNDTPAATAGAADDPPSPPTSATPPNATSHPWPSSPGHFDRLIYALVGRVFSRLSPVPFGGKLKPGFSSYTGTTPESCLDWMITKALEPPVRGRGRRGVLPPGGALEWLVGEGNEVMRIERRGGKDEIDELLLRGMMRAGHFVMTGRAVIPMHLRGNPPAGTAPGLGRGCGGPLAYEGGDGHVMEEQEGFTGMVTGVGDYDEDEKDSFYENDEDEDDE